MSRKEFLLEFRNVLKLYGNNSSFTWNSGSKTFAINYTSLDYLSQELEQTLVHIIKPNHVYVGVMLKNKKLAIPIILALWKNYMAPVALSNITVDILCQELKIKYIITDENCNFKQPAVKFNIFNSDLFLYNIMPDDIQSQFNGLDMCYALSTSGSTGVPKAVQVPWSCILTNAQELLKTFKINQSDVISSYSPITFDPFFIEMFLALLSGAVLNLEDIRPSSLNISLPMAFKIGCNIERINPKYASIIQVTPSVFKTLSEKVFKNLRILILGGEQFPKINVSLPNVLIFNIYGITEISCWCSLHEVTNTTPKVPIGKPLQGVTFRIEDNELLVGSASRQCVVGNEPIEVSNEIRWRRTGDLVEFDPDTNEMYVLGRKDSVIKIFGTKLSMEKVHKQLSSMVFIKDFSIIFDEETQSIGWFLVYNMSNIKEIEVHNISDLEELKDVYSSLTDLEKPRFLFKMNSLPLTIHGKKNDSLLKSILSKEQQKSQFSTLEDTFDSVWCETLGLLSLNPVKSFVDSGGNSILAMKLLSRLDHFHIKIPEKLISYLTDSRHSYNDCLELLQHGVTEHTSRAITDAADTAHSLIQKWAFNMNKCIDSSPTLLHIDGKLFVTVGSHSSQISLVDAENGSEAWSTLLGDRVEAGIAKSADSERLYTASYDQCIYCLSSRTGCIIWKTRTGGMVKSTPVLDSAADRLYCGSYDKQLYCLNAQNGEVLGSVLLNGSLLATPVLRDGLILSGSLAGECYCVSGDNLSTLWRTRVDSPVFSSPCLLSRCRVLMAQVQGTIHCFNVNNGCEEWQLKCGGNIFSGLTTINETDLVAFGCHDRHLYLIDASDEPYVKWKRLLESAVACAPAVNDALMACVTSCGVLNLLDLDGNVLAKLDLGDETFASPRFFGNNIYVGSRNDNLMCIGVKYNSH